MLESLDHLHRQPPLLRIVWLNTGAGRVKMAKKPRETMRFHRAENNKSQQRPEEIGFVSQK